MNEVGRRKKQVTIVALVTALCLLGDSMLYITLPIFYEQVGLQSLWEVGLLLSINRFVRIPMNPLVGFMYRKFQLKTGLYIAVVLAVITTVGYGIGTGLFIWVLLRLLWGIAWSFLRLGGFFTILHASTDRNRGENMGRYNGLYRLGSLGGMIGGGVLVSMIGFQPTVIAFGLSMVIGIPLVYKGITKNPSQNLVVTPEITPKKKVFFGLTCKAITTITSGMILAFLIQGMFNSSISLVMVMHFGEEISLYRWTIGITALAGTLQGVRWLWEPYLAVRLGRVSDGEQGRLPLFLLALVVSAMGFVFIPIPLPLAIWLGMILFVMAASTTLTTLVDALTSDEAQGQDANRLMTIYSVFLDLGAAMGPLVSYFLFSIGGTVVHVFNGAAVVFMMLFVYWSAIYFQTKKEQHKASINV
ncbi:MFS family permease [Natronobacillus azotifigens]|uniref:MFS transporter n=1 Tax=Natronobacillus azotifigens TaxID=472978 RepID=A0A9J6RAF2_9BACI|nr:MFS transporter [Natronobacillus azotifigens]